MSADTSGIAAASLATGSIPGQASWLPVAVAVGAVVLRLVLGLVQRRLGAASQPAWRFAIGIASFAVTWLASMSAIGIVRGTISE